MATPDKKWFTKCMDLVDQKRYTEALDCLDQVILLNANNADAWCEKGKILTRLQRFEDSLQYFDNALKINPDHKED